MSNIDPCLVIQITYIGMIFILSVPALSSQLSPGGNQQRPVCPPPIKHILVHFPKSLHDQKVHLLENSFIKSGELKVLLSCSDEDYPFFSANSSKN